MFPIHMNLGPFYLPFYEGFYFLISILVGVILGTRYLKKIGLNEDKIWSIVTWSILGAVIGGRLFHVIFWGTNYYWLNPEKIFAFWEGGISITGGIFGALVTAAIACRAQEQSFLQYAAEASPYILLSQGIGRIGCFLNGDAFGVPTNLPWGIQEPRYGRELIGMAQNTNLDSGAWTWLYRQKLVTADSTVTIPLHPTQLYESFFDLLFVVFLFYLRGKKATTRVRFLMYLGGYSLFRFLVEYIRGDRENVLFLNTTGIQFTLLLTAIICAIIIIYDLTRKPVPEPVKKGKVKK